MCFLLTLKRHVSTKPDDKKRFVIGFVNMPYQQLMSKKAFGWRLTRLLSGFKERNQRFCSINLHCFTPATHSQKPNRTQACEQKPKCLAASDRFGLQRWISDHIQFRILPYELAHADMMGIGTIPPITKTPQVLTLDTWNAVILDNFFLGDGCDVYSVLQWKLENCLCAIKLLVWADTFFLTVGFYLILSMYLYQPFLQLYKCFVTPLETFLPQKQQKRNNFKTTSPRICGLHVRNPWFAFVALASKLMDVGGMLME